MKSPLVPQVVLALAYTLTLCPLNAGAQPPASPSTPPPAVPPPAATGSQPAAAQSALPAPTIDYPAPPEPGVYVSDRGAVLSIDSTKQINKTAAEIFFATDVPVFVVTIRSVEHMGGEPATSAAGVEQYARTLFDRWGVGAPQDSRAVLIFYSRGDNRVHMLLGKGWPETANIDAAGIASNIILPPVQRSAPAEGLLAGLKAAGAMINADNAKRFPDRVARQDPMAPAAPVPSSSPIQGAPTWIWIGIGVVVLIVLGFLALLLKSREPGDN